MRSNLLLGLLILLAGSAAGRENSTEVYRLGVEDFKSGNITEAEKKFERAVILNRYYCLGYYGLGRVYLLKKETIEQAVTNLKKTVELDARFARGHFYLGLAQYLNGNLVAALHAFKEAYRLDPGMVESLYNIGMIYDRMKKKYQSNFYYSKYLTEKQKSAGDLVF